MGMADDRAAAGFQSGQAGPSGLRRPGPYPGPPGYVPIPPVQVPKQPTSITGGPAGAFMSTLPRGASAGFIDPAAKSRAAQTARWEYPVAALAGDIVGSGPAAITGGQLMSRGLDAATSALMGGRALRPMAKAPVIGATEGAVYGAGYSPEDRVAGAMTGGVAGGVLGAGGEAVVGGGRQLLGRAAGRGTETAPQQAVREAVEFDTGVEGRPMVAAAEEQIRAAGRGGIPADIGPATLQQLDQAVVSGGGPVRARAENVLYGRAAESFSNITEPMRRKLAPGGREFMSTNWDELAEVRRQQSSPLYEMAYARGIPHDDPVLAKALRTQPVQKAWRRAQQLTAMDPEMTPQQLAQIAGPEGRPSLRGWQYIKEQLDQQASQARSQARAKDASAVEKLRDYIVDRLDELQPTYREARNIWAGTRAAEDAMQMGYDFMSTRKMSQFPMAKLRRLNDSERAYFRIGAMSYFEDLLGNTQLTHDMTRKFRTDSMRRRLGQVFETPEDLNDFYALLDAEATKNKAKKVLGGSPTAGRLTEQSAWEAMEQAGQLSQATGVGTTMAAMRNALTTPMPARTGPMMQMGRDVSDLLLEQDPARQRAMLEAMTRRRPLPPLRGAAAGVAGAPGGYLDWER